MDTPEFRDRIADAAVNKARQLRHLHHAHGRVRGDLRAHGRAALPTAICFISRAAPSASRTPSRPPSTGRSARTSRKPSVLKGPRRSCIAASAPRRTGYTLSLTNTDRARRSTSRSSTGRAIENQKSPSPPRGVAGRRRAPASRSRSNRPSIFSTSARTTSPLSSGADPGRRRRQPLPPRVLRAVRQLCDENDMLSSSMRCSPASASPARCVLPALRHRADLFCFGKKRRCGRLRSTNRSWSWPTTSSGLSASNSTWGGNFTDMVRAQRYFEIIDEENLVENAARVGAYFVGELDRFHEEFPSLVSTSAAAASWPPSTSPAATSATPPSSLHAPRRHGPLLGSRSRPLPPAAQPLDGGTAEGPQDGKALKGLA